MWDCGKKQHFVFALGHVGKDSKGEYQRINGYDANFWFYVSKGKTDTVTLANAMRRLRASMKHNGYSIAGYEYLENPYE